MKKAAIFCKICLEYFLKDAGDPCPECKTPLTLENDELYKEGTPLLSQRPIDRLAALTRKKSSPKKLLKRRFLFEMALQEK